MKLPDDPILLELIPELIETWIEDINTSFDDFYTRKDVQEMYRLAHTIKGSCYQFALNEIGDVGVEMLQKVKNEDWENIYQYKKILLDMFFEVKELIDEIENN